MYDAPTLNGKMKKDKKAYLWKVPLRVTNQQTRLSTPSIPHHNELFRVRRRLRQIGRLRHPSTRRNAGICANGPVTDSHALAADSTVTRCPRRSWRRGRKRLATWNCIHLVVVHLA